jgi:hypothetical protein
MEVITMPSKEVDIAGPNKRAGAGDDDLSHQYHMTTLVHKHITNTRHL